MLTPRQYKLLMFINKTIKETGSCPSFDEMRKAIGLKSKSSVHSLIESLVERNYINKLPNRARALEVIRMPKVKPSSIIEEEKRRESLIENGGVKIPFYGNIAAGVPIDAIANETEFLSVPKDFIGKGNYYALTVCGDSMQDGGILDGDTAIVKKVSTASNGDIVVALIDNNETTLKVFRREGSTIKLMPQNKNYEPIVVDSSKVEVQGILSGIMRNY